MKPPPLGDILILLQRLTLNDQIQIYIYRDPTRSYYSTKPQCTIVQVYRALYSLKVRKSNPKIPSTLRSATVVKHHDHLLYTHITSCVPYILSILSMTFHMLQNICSCLSDKTLTHMLIDIRVTVAPASTKNLNFFIIRSFFNEDI